LLKTVPEVTEMPAPLVYCTGGGMLIAKLLVPGELTPAKPTVELTLISVSGTCTLYELLDKVVVLAAPVETRDVVEATGMLILKLFVPADVTPANPTDEETLMSVGGTCTLYKFAERVEVTAAPEEVTDVAGTVGMLIVKLFGARLLMAAAPAVVVKAIEAGGTSTVKFKPVVGDTFAMPEA